LRTHLASAELRERRGDTAGAAADLAEADRLFERLGLSGRVPPRARRRSVTAGRGSPGSRRRAR
jgi:hypothetical protein